MATGYVLINVEPGFEFSVYESIGRFDQVADSTLLFGDYDLIAKVVADNMAAIAQFVVEEIRQIEGVQNTKTLAGAEVWVQFDARLASRKSGFLPNFGDVSRFPAKYS